VRGLFPSVAIVERTSWSVNTLQEQTIILGRPGGQLVQSATIFIAGELPVQKENRCFDEFQSIGEQR